jgi:hypothetical protein
MAKRFSGVKKFFPFSEFIIPPKDERNLWGKAEEKNLQTLKFLREASAGKHRQ